MNNLSVNKKKSLRYPKWTLHSCFVVLRFQFHVEGTFEDRANISGHGDSTRFTCHSWVYDT